MLCSSQAVPRHFWSASEKELTALHRGAISTPRFCQDHETDLPVQVLEVGAAAHKLVGNVSDLLNIFPISLQARCAPHLQHLDALALIPCLVKQMSTLMCQQVQLPEQDPNDLENHLLQATCSVSIGLVFLVRKDSVLSLDQHERIT